MDIFAQDKNSLNQNIPVVRQFNKTLEIIREAICGEAQRNHGNTTYHEHTKNNTFTS